MYISPLSSANQPGLVLDPIPGQEDYLTYEVGGLMYAIPLVSVQEIRGFEKVTPIANMPDYVLGVLNLRGTVVPILDLRVRLNAPEILYSNTTVVIMVTTPARTLGLVVDAVADIESITAAELQALNDSGQPLALQSSQGLALLGSGKTVAIFDMTALEGNA